MVDLTTGLTKPRSNIDLLTQGVAGPDQPLAAAETDQPSNFRAAPTFPPLDPNMQASLDLIHSKESSQGNRPNYRYDDKHTAGGDLQITDTNWRHYAPQLGIDTKLFPNAMSANKDMQYQVGAKMKAEMGYGPWFPYNAALRQALRGQPTSADNPAFPSAAIARQGAKDIQDEAFAAAGRTSDEARSLIKNIGAEKGDIETSMRRIREAQDKSDEAQQAVLKATKQQPHEPLIDGIKQFGSVASIVGLLGGLFTRRPLQAALNASAAAIEAANKGDLRDYKIHYDAWKDNTELLQNIAKANRERIHDILSNEQMGINAKERLLDVTLRAMGMENLADKGRLEGLGAVQDVNIKMYEAETRLEAARNRVINSASQYGRGLAGLTLKAFVEEYEAREGHKPGLDELMDFSARQKGIGSGRLTPEATDMAARLWIAGDERTISQLARAGPARTQVENRASEILKDEPEGVQLMVMNRIRMVGARTAAQTANRVTMNVAIYEHGARSAAQQVVDASAAFPRTELPKLNEIYAALEKGTGDPRVIRLGMSINYLINEYGKISNPTGQAHDADKKRIDEILSIGLNQGQMESAANQVIAEGLGQGYAAEEAEKEVLGLAVPKVPGYQGTPSFGPQTPPPQYPSVHPTPVTPALAPPTATPRATTLPEGVPPGSVHAGTSKGKPVWRAPDGSLYGEQ